jgi:hypothetical protein
VHLLVRLFDTAADARAGKRWARTLRAVELYLALGFEERGEHHACAYPNYDETCQRYMVVDVNTLAERLANMAQAEEKGHATWVSQAQCRVAAAGRPWFEVAAIDAIVAEHDEAHGGDGAKPADVLPVGPLADRFTLFEAVPREPERPATTEAEAEAVGDAAAEAEAEGGDAPEYEYEVREEAGEFVRDYADAPRRECPDGVETDTATSDGKVIPSWGATAAFEVLTYLLLERLRGAVVLPGGRSAYFGYKMTYDAAVVRRA